MPKGKGKGDKKNKYKRSQGTKDKREVFLIVCEGEETEPNYFKSFRMRKDVVVGAGANTVSVVERAIHERENHKKAPFDQVWAVFDRDSFPKERFNSALQLADNEGIKVAYSNEAFEIWYLLHFQYLDSAISRQRYKDMIEGHMKQEYKKNSPNMYDELEDKRETAIQNAENLLSKYNPPDPAEDNPSTTVHKLVNELVKNSPDANRLNL